jgi:COP9 signalosome complex subunit 7
MLTSRPGLPALEPPQARKLKQLTLASLAAKHSQLGYDLLRAELEIDSLRELEDLVLDTVYQGLIDAKIDQAQKKVIVDWAIGRDVRDRLVVFLR